jgi:hypothetical protein
MAGLRRVLDLVDDYKRYGAAARLVEEIKAAVRAASVPR